jgi:hypothetical protein
MAAGTPRLTGSFLKTRTGHRRLGDEGREARTAAGRRELGKRRARCDNGDHKHNWRFHQFGNPHADPWGDPQLANSPKHEARSEYEREIEHASYENRLHESSVRFRSMRLQFCCCTLGVPFGQHMKQISDGKQRETKNSTPEVEVVTDAILQAPLHPRKQVKRLADMDKDDDHQTSRAD